MHGCPSISFKVLNFLFFVFKIQFFVTTDWLTDETKETASDLNFPTIDDLNVKPKKIFWIDELNVKPKQKYLSLKTVTVVEC